MKNLDIRWLVALAGLVLFIVLVGRGGQQPDAFPGEGATLPPLMVAGWLNGPPPSEEEMQGNVLVIDYWASWCGPCREATPHLVESYHRFRQQGVKFIGLTPETADELDQVQQFIDYYSTNWPIGYGADHALQALGVQGLPTVLVVGRDGKIAQGFVGWTQAAGERLDAAIEAALVQ